MPVTGFPGHNRGTAKIRLSEPQMNALKLLCNRRMTAAEIVDETTVSMISVRSLKRRGLVRRNKSTLVYSITRAGEKVVNETFKKD